MPDPISMSPARWQQEAQQFGRFKRTWDLHILPPSDPRELPSHRPLFLGWIGQGAAIRPDSLLMFRFSQDSCTQKVTRSSARSNLGSGLGTAKFKSFQMTQDSEIVAMRLALMLVFTRVWVQPAPAHLHDPLDPG